MRVQGGVADDLQGGTHNFVFSVGPSARPQQSFQENLSGPSGAKARWRSVSVVRAEALTYRPDLRYSLASFMSSRARRRALFASVLALDSGLRRSMAL